MRWLIGLDLRGGGSGALGFAKWLREQGSDRAPDEVTCAHVVEESTILRYEYVVELEHRIATYARQAMEAAGIHPSERNPRIIFGVSPDTGLADVAGELGADAIIVGRRAGKHDERFVRLGGVARRLLRKLPVPIVIVPPDAPATGLGRGPLILATDLTDDSVGAATFAHEMGRMLDRPVVATHIVPDSTANLPFLPAATLEQLYDQLGMPEGQNIEAWLARHGLTDVSTALATGGVVDRILAIAEREETPLIICGSRQRSTTERLFGSSVGSTLAAYAQSPVVVVPPNFVFRDAASEAALVELVATG